MTKKKRPNFSADFRLETAQLVVDNGNTHEDAAKAMGGLVIQPLANGLNSLENSVKGSNLKHRQ